MWLNRIEDNPMKKNIDVTHRLNMKVYDVAGVPNAVNVDEANNHVYVSYFDEPKLSVYDLNFEPVCEIAVQGGSAYANLLASNLSYLAFLSKPKVVALLNKKNIFEPVLEIDLNQYHCGAVNGIHFFTERFVVITTNSAIGKKDIRKNLFIYDTVDKKMMQDLDSGIYIKFSTVSQSRIVIVGSVYDNKRDIHQSAIASINTLTGINEMEVFADGEVQSGFAYFSKNNDKKQIFVKGKDDKYIGFVDETDIDIEHTGISNCLAGAIMHDCQCVIKNNDAMQVIAFMEIEYGQFKFAEYPSIALGDAVATGAITVSNDEKTVFCGVDKEVYVITLK